MYYLGLTMSTIYYLLYNMYKLVIYTNEGLKH